MSGVKIHWGRIITALILGVILAGMAWWWLTGVSEPKPALPTHTQSQGSDDPWHGVPACTDEIADAGGICHGEPTAEPNGLAVVPVTVTEPVTPVEEVNEDPWLTAPDGTRHFEDGSWIDADGVTGCTDGMPCSQLPPVPAGTPTTPDGGYWPTLTLEACAQEDSDNCYWDAELRGNGTGQSFIVVDGVHYYREINK